MKLICRNDVYQLRDQLIDDYQEKKNNLGVFGQYTIAVPNKSVEHWLTAQIVQKVGISSGIRFVVLHKFLNKVYRRGTESPAVLVNKDQLAGLFYELLTELNSGSGSENTSLEILKNWLNSQNHEQSVASLSQALADVFELYQIYRSDWLDAWSKGEAVLNNDSEIWQAEIWRLIINRLPEGMLQHRQQLKEAFAVVFSGQDGIPSLNGIQQLSIFGVNQLDPMTLSQLDSLSKSIDVNYFWQSSSAHLFGLEGEFDNNKALVETRSAYFSGNTLLASWGGLSRQQYLAFGSAGFSAKPDKVSAESNSDSLLSKVRVCVVNNDACELHRTLQPDEKSISINSHFSRYREIEGLHDFLLECFNNIKNLKPDDIIVLCPDINNYSSYIHAVFENQIENKIPVQVCGMNPQASDTASVILELIALPETRYVLSDIIDLLNHSYIRKRFELSAGDVEDIHVWFKQANIYWGLDKTTLKQLQLPKYDRYTLQCGIDRMVLGLSLDGKSLQLGDELVYGIEGITALKAATLSKLISFVDSLRDWRDICLQDSGDQQSYNISDWCGKFRTVTETFIDVPRKKRESINKWYRLISDLEQSFIENENAVEYSYAFVKSLLAKKVTEDSIGSGAYRYGKVNFGSFGVLKAIPGKIIACLGMNESDFPRKPPVDSINLALKHRRLGDRDPVNQDKDAFLMALLNCREAFYCSYVGKDMRSNNERIPSLVLQELLDYIQPNSDEQEDLVNSHPMKPYSDAYFKKGTNLFTYQSYACQSDLNQNADSSQYDMGLPKWEMPEQITIQDLKTFLEDPAKAFFKARFNVNLPGLDDETGDEEPLSENALTRWKYIDELLQAGIRSKDSEISDELIEGVNEYFKASGLMEHDLRADGEFEEWVKTANSVLSNASGVIDNKQPTMVPVDLSLSVDGQTIKLVGDINIFTDENSSGIIHLVHNISSGVKTKYLMKAIVDTRIAEAMTFDGKDFKQTFLACKNGLYTLVADQEPDNSSLKHWLGLYKEVMTAPIAMDLIAAEKISTNQPYRDAFEVMLEDIADSFSKVDFSEDMKVLINDDNAVNRSEAYIESYRYFGLTDDFDVKPTEPHWVEYMPGKQS